MYDSFCIACILQIFACSCIFQKKMHRNPKNAVWSFLTKNSFVKSDHFFNLWITDRFVEDP